MSNEILIGSISEEKAKQLKVYKEHIINSIGFDLLVEEQKEMYLSVLDAAYSNGWIDCQHTCIKKISDLT